jgi:hypothetical protein
MLSSGCHRFAKMHSCCAVRDDCFIPQKQRCFCGCFGQWVDERLDGLVVLYREGGCPECVPVQNVCQYREDSLLPVAGWDGLGRAGTVECRWVLLPVAYAYVRGACTDVHVHICVCNYDRCIAAQVPALRVCTILISEAKAASRAWWSRPLMCIALCCMHGLLLSQQHRCC